ncbi:hypothetical protein Tco_0648618 [Tanacetum coccineum]
MAVYEVFPSIIRGLCAYSIRARSCDVEEVLKGALEKLLESIEDEEVSLVDGVLEGALGALEALEMEALVDASILDSGLMYDVGG